MTDLQLLNGDCLDVLKSLPRESVQTCVTSPPYFGLRDYGTASWDGGDAQCSHRRDSKKSDKTITGHKNFDDMLGVGDAIQRSVCSYCGAVLVDRQIGLEETPEEYAQKMVEVFRGVRDVLKDDGTLWLNLGDSYMSAKGVSCDPQTIGGQRGMPSSFVPPNRRDQEGLKNKDLIGIPWRVAFALQADGWYLRQDIIWHKPNPMPESVKDRCTKAHEYIFLLSKSPQYYFDSEAVKEESQNPGKTRKFRDAKENSHLTMRQDNGRVYEPDGFRNKRSVWTVNTKPYAEAHFATFPPKLITPCILAGSREGDTVLDPFNGSGTTGLVSLRNRRKYIGIELNPDYITLSRKRLSSVQVEMFV